MVKTNEDLENAFAGESQANRRYLAFARKAEEEGYPQIGKLFRAAAEAETVHALNHFRIIGEAKTTVENLKSAVSGESVEYREMYPEYIKDAEQENNQQAVWSFKVAKQVEETHANLFAEAAKTLKEGKQLPKSEYYVCNVCGNTVENEPPEKCSVCGSPRTKFYKVD